MQISNILFFHGNFYKEVDFSRSYTNSQHILVELPTVVKLKLDAF